MTKLLATDGEGERLDRFELVAELASGGMATVFLARLSGVAGFQRLVAIKRLHPHLAREPEFVEMFLDEARLAARIHHPNVVPIQEVGESDQGYYLVMDYVEGDTLARLLARAAQAKTTIPYAVTIRILLDVLAGLHAAHELVDDMGQPLELVHRDVSPQNILVGVDGVARLVDFGVARAASRLATTRSGQLKGKLAYMAPEQARGGNIDRRADLFSCGIVLWEALALKRLFKGDGEAETLNRVLYEPIPVPSSVKPDVPKTLEAICMRALERDVDKRWPTADELAQELEKAARALTMVGSVRDVATCLEQVVGSDLSQQRDAVRAWLTRSEPNTGSGPRSRKTFDEISASAAAKAKDSVMTRVEGSGPPGRVPSSPSSSKNGRASEASEGGKSVGRASEASEGGKSVGRASEASEGGKSVDRGAVTAPAPDPPIEKVSSVSSAVIMVPPSSLAGPPPSVQPVSRMRTGFVVVAILAAAVLGGGGVWTATHFQKPIAASSTTTPPIVAAPAPVPTPTPTPEPAAVAPLASATPEPSTTTSAARPGTKKGVPSRPIGTGKPITRPTSTGTAAPPDDLGNNPYR